MTPTPRRICSRAPRADRAIWQGPSGHADRNCIASQPIHPHKHCLPICDESLEPITDNERRLTVGGRRLCIWCMRTLNTESRRQ